MPKSLDPARASSAPETDIVRAMYEGVTVIDANTLDAAPGVAESWHTSEDGLEWEFTFRENAKWSNGRRVTAADFVRSWGRLSELDEAAHKNLLANFAVTSGESPAAPESPAEDFEQETEQLSPGRDQEAATPAPLPTAATIEVKRPAKQALAVTAPDERKLVVRLKRPDKDFAKLISHPIFMPVFRSGRSQDRAKLDPNAVGNGPFQISDLTSNEIVLERSKSYWNSENVKVERLRFVPIEKSDDALEAYRSGAIDALTNTEISPLAQKLFSTASDFRKNVFGALNFYEINHRKSPFNDRRVREALAISIEREQFLADDGETTLQPAFSIMPFGSGTQKKLVQDKERALELLEQAGFPGGQGFAPIRLTVNRNETQLRIARAVARMWKDTLNIETILEVRESDEIASIRESGEYDILRRGVVFPVPDELACITAVHGGDPARQEPDVSEPRPGAQPNSNGDSSNLATPLQSPNRFATTEPIFTETDALFQFHVIPLYFPRSFALVKPYVKAFELNSLDAPNLTATEIDVAWQPVTR